MKRLTLLFTLAIITVLRYISAFTNLSTTGANTLLGSAVGKAPTLPTSLSLDWLTTSLTMPGATGAVVVTTGQVTNYAATAIAASDFGSAASGSIANSAAKSSPTSSGGTGATVLGARINDNAANVWWGVVLGSSFSYASGVSPTIAIGALTLSIS